MTLCERHRMPPDALLYIGPRTHRVLSDWPRWVPGRVSESTSTHGLDFWCLLFPAPGLLLTLSLGFQENRMSIGDLGLSSDSRPGM